ncbi:uncharacterized protein F4822DRAFT_150754 [Hypoxylon trugodes]|uniref:uncharacterized protein n=1 Tax=Hypoxylon trugodes TaxID=326681 RepID=UPI00218DEA12|nr:uncharacterized protein F4822DRAFT_150754 [Hypoxylon trugodes]KAI1382539.1 hypothetical protein F4822DRAFT_150754 [Hypoxylon trugodes]
MDDPWDWDTNRLVRELCSLDRTWTPSSNNPKLPHSLETRLREQEADGHTILTYNEGELFDALGIQILKHKSTCRDALNQFREQSQKYKLFQTEPVDDPSTERTIVAPPRKQRRIAPTAVSYENDINAQHFLSSFGPDVITRPDRLDAPAGIDGLREDPITTDDDTILPLYGDSDSDEEYDSETWKEIQQEQNEKIASGKHLPAFDAEVITDEAIQAFVSDWQRCKLPKLVPRANKLWHDARKNDLNEAVEQVRGTLQLYETRLGTLREGILCQQWSDEAELRSVIPALEQTVLDLQSASWRLRIVSSPQEPDKLSPSQSAPSHSTKPRRSRLDNRDGEETLSSESEGDQGDFIVNDVSDELRPCLELSFVPNGC